MSKMARILNLIVGVQWLIRAVLVFTGVEQMSSFSAACACLCASLAFFNLAMFNKLFEED